MPTLNAREVDRVLVSKLGFEKTDTHHHLYRLRLKGKLVARTHISHGALILSPFHVAQMAKQLHLSVEEFVKAAKCPLSRAQYYCLVYRRIPELNDVKT